MANDLHERPEGYEDLDDSAGRGSRPVVSQRRKALRAGDRALRVSGRGLPPSPTPEDGKKKSTEDQG